MKFQKGDIIIHNVHDSQFNVDFKFKYLVFVTDVEYTIYYKIINNYNQFYWSVSIEFIDKNYSLVTDILRDI